MEVFYYLVRATAGNNVGTIEADNADNALRQLEDIYAPVSPITGDKHKLVSVELISAAEYETEKQHIAAVHKQQAEM